MKNSARFQYLFFLILVCLCSFAEGAEENDRILLKATAELEQQNQAWNDLSVNYICEGWTLEPDGKWKWYESLVLRWSVTQAGWERILRSRPESSWVEEASFNGEYSMTFDSQQEGSAGFGHQVASFLNITDSPKIYGLYVTGLELGRPVSVAEYLKMESAQVKVLSQTGNLVVVAGDDPFAVGVHLKLTLDSNYGYRPIEIEVRDQRGLLSTYKDIEYEKFTGTRGDFWFPRKGSWYGVNPEERSPGIRMDYKLTNIKIDQNSVKEDFQLTYPKGTLLLNTDTGETTYALEEVRLEDLIGETGKTISMEQHDWLAARNQQHVPGEEDKKSTMILFVLANLAIVAFIGLAIFIVRCRRHNSV
tara:strand:- start:33063 stop:34148 length:1086 start_codon:yes stop_codon:yes gene_type:complete